LIVDTLVLLFAVAAGVLFLYYSEWLATDNDKFSNVRGKEEEI